jgi:homoserine dehydrogenase
VVSKTEKHWRLGFAGFGRVNRALASTLIDRREELRRRYGLTFEVTLLATATRGVLIEEGGLDPLAAFRAGWSSGVSTIEAIRTAPIDLLFEGTPLDPVRGEPASTHARIALERGVSVVSANKGPVAFAADELIGAAATSGAGFRFESAVADCLPVFDCFEVVVPVGRITRFQGILNSTSNLVLQAMVRGESMEGAVATAQRIGIAEADPSHDLDGWDQAVKAAILTHLLLGQEVLPADVDRTPLSQVDVDWVRSEQRAGRTIRLAAEGAIGEPPRVGPVALQAGSFLASLGGDSLGIMFDTELAGTLALGIVEPRVEQTAYGMLSDLVAIHQGRKLVPSPLPPVRP